MQSKQSFFSGAITCVALAAGLAVSGQVAAQTVLTLQVGSDFLVGDPFGSGRSEYVRYLSSNTDVMFGNGDFAQTGDTFDIGGTLGALNVGKLVVGGTGGWSVAQQYQTDELNESIRTSVNLATPNISMSVVVDGPNSGQISTMTTGAGSWSLTGTRISGTLTGGESQLSNLRFNLAAGQVVADLAGTKSAVGTKPAVAYNSPNTVLWTFDPATDVAGATRLTANSLLVSNPWADPSSGYTYTYEGYDRIVTGTTHINNLQITAEGTHFLINSLGLLAAGQDAFNAVNNSTGGWGSVTLVNKFIAVPEPSTYALMGLGLVGISLAARRQK